MYSDFIFWWWNQLIADKELYMFLIVWIMALLMTYLWYIDSHFFNKKKPITSHTISIALCLSLIALFPFLHIIVLTIVIYGLIELYYRIKLEHE